MTITDTRGTLYRGRNIPSRFSERAPHPTDGGLVKFRPGFGAQAEQWAVATYVDRGRDVAVVHVTMDGSGPLDDNWAPGSYVLLDPAQEV